MLLAALGTRIAMTKKVSLTTEHLSLEDTFQLPSSHFCAHPYGFIDGAGKKKEDR